VQNWFFGHTFLQGTGCLIGCVSLTFQGGHFIFGLSAFSATPFPRDFLTLKGLTKIRAFAGVSAGISAADYKQNLASNVDIGGAIADGYGGGGGVMVDSTGKDTHVYPYAFATVGEGWEAQAGPNQNWDLGTPLDWGHATASWVASWF
jgi:hypothetical protein